MTRFKERSLGGIDGRSRPHPSSAPAPKDHREWSAWWGQQCISAMESHVKHDLSEALEHAVRSARLAWWHACKAKKYPYWQPEKL